MRTTEDILAPPTDADVQRALTLFSEAVAAAYGRELAALYLFGSRARGDHHPFSDADVAVVLHDENWQLVPEKRRLARLAYDVIVETGVDVQGWPVSLAAWREPDRHSNPELVRRMRRDGKPLRTTS